MAALRLEATGARGVRQTGRIKAGAVAMATVPGRRLRGYVAQFVDIGTRPSRLDGTRAISDFDPAMLGQHT